MITELKEKQSPLGITGGSHTLADDIPNSEMAGELTTPRPTENMFHDILLHTANDCRRNPPRLLVSLLQVGRVSPARSAADSLTDGVIPPRRSLYTPLVPKTAILRVTTRCSQILRPSTVWGGQLYPLKTRILVAAAFVISKVNHKNDGTKSYCLNVIENNPATKEVPSL